MVLPNTRVFYASGTAVRAKSTIHIKKDWPPRKNIELGSKNILKSSLIPANKVLLPPLHIKLGLIKQFVKAMKTENSDASSIYFKYIYEKFLKLSEAKIKEGMFDDLQIRALLNDKVFEEKMTVKEKAAWQSFREVTLKFLGNIKDPQYKNIVERMVTSFQNLGCLMNLKLHFLDSHIEYFWGLKKDTETSHKRKVIRRSFKSKKTRCSRKKE